MNSIFHSAQVSSDSAAPGLYLGSARFESLLQQTLLRHIFSRFSLLHPDNRSNYITLLKRPKKAPEHATVILLHSNHRHVSITHMLPSSGWHEQEHNYKCDVSETIHS
jgi:hypothetical protein